MSKALQSLNQEKKIFSIIEPILQKTIERQDEQGTVIRTMFEGVKSMYSEFAEGMAEMKDMVEEVRNSVTLTNAECFEIQSAVASKSNSLTKDRYHDEDESFSKMVGKYRQMIWKQLKQKFNTPRYNCIRRVDHIMALSFVENFRPEDYM